MSGMEWPEVRKQAEAFSPFISDKYPRYRDEMQGVADGAGVPYLDILALNIRSEIAFSMFTEPKANGAIKHDDMESDGCTSLAWKTANGKSFLAQNWDWKPRQRANLIVLRIRQPGTELVPFQMITEAGIIGKIGFNENGIGCCLNAIRARGVDPTRMPVHFGLRTVLESPTRSIAIEKIKAAGIAASAHILIGDQAGATGLECTNVGFGELHPDSHGRIVHANHLVLPHADVDEPPWMADSPERAARLEQLATLEVGNDATLDSVNGLFKDEENYPTSINRKCVDGSTSETLFNVVFDLAEKKGWVSLGRPTEVLERVSLGF
jgi:isopenicillin-N N-acyltransferase-like protein